MVKKITLRDKIDAVLKWIVLIVIGGFTVFPFFWMIVSALKTKAEIMDTSRFFPETMQWENFASIIFDSPVPMYILKSRFVTVGFGKCEFPVVVE